MERPLPQAIVTANWSKSRFAYGEGGGPFDRGDDTSKPMEEGSGFGAHAPLRLNDDGVVRHPGFAAESLCPLMAALMSRISCGRASRRCEGGIAMIGPQGVDDGEVEGQGLCRGPPTSIG